MPRLNEPKAPLRAAPGSKKLALAAQAGKNGNYPLAIKILRELISETDAPPEAWLLLGRSLHACKEYSLALAAFNDFVRLRPQAGEAYLFIGRTYLTVGLPYKAVPFLRKAIEKKPGKYCGLDGDEYKSKTKALLGTAYLKSRNSQAAVDVLQEAVEAAPLDKRIYRAYLNSLLLRGIRLCRIYNYDLGLQMLRFVLSNRESAGMGESTLLRLELGRAARETGNLEEALEHFTAALKQTRGGHIKEGDRRIRWSRASILMALGKTTEARKEIEIIRSHDKGVPELPWNNELVDLFMIRSFMDSGEWRRAAESCRGLLRSSEENKSRKTMPGTGSSGASLGKSLLHAIYSEALRNLGNFEAAHNHLQRALEQEPGDLDLWYADILVSWEGKDYKAARKAIRTAKSLGGDKQLLDRFEILNHAFSSGDSFGNITLLQNAIRRLGPEPELMYAMGAAYLKVGLLEEAISWFKKTISIKKGHEKAWLGQIAALEASAGEGFSSPEELSGIYKKYLEIWPSNSNIRRDRALFLVKTFEYGEAAGELEKLLVWEPSNPSLRRVLAYAYRKTGRYREAAVYLKALLKEKPRDISLLIEFSGCLDRAGASKFAIEVLEKARKVFSSSGDVPLALGILYFRHKKVEKAFDSLREAAVLSPKDPRPYEWMSVMAKKNGDRDFSHYEKEAEKRKNPK